MQAAEDLALEYTESFFTVYKEDLLNCKTRIMQLALHCLYLCYVVETLSITCVMLTGASGKSKGSDYLMLASLLWIWHGNVGWRPVKMNLQYFSAGKNTCHGMSDCRPRALGHTKNLTQCQRWWLPFDVCVGTDRAKGVKPSCLLLELSLEVFAELSQNSRKRMLLQERHLRWKKAAFAEL